MGSAEIRVKTGHVLDVISSLWPCLIYTVISPSIGVDTFLLYAQSITL